MTTFLSTFATLLSIAAGVPPAPYATPFVVQGYLPATKAPKAYLSYRRGTTYVVDSAVITKSRFRFKGLVATPQQAQLQLPSPGTSQGHLMREDVVTIYLEKGTITVTGTGRTELAVATGTPLNCENAALATQLAPIRAQLTTLNEAWARRPAAERADTTLQQQSEARAAQLRQQLDKVYVTYLRAHPANAFSLYALADYEGSQPDVDTYLPLFQALAPSLRTSPQGLLMQAQLTRLQRTALGALAPDFSLPDPDGKLVKLSELRGQYVLLDFWASWCQPCRAENPRLAQAYAAYKGKNFNVVSISLDNQRAAWLTAIQADKLTWPQASDLKGFNAGVAQQYTIASIPQNFLLDPQGHIVAKNLSGEALLRKLGQVLGQPN